MTNTAQKRAGLYILAFIIPAAAAMVSFWVKGIAPFGDGFITNWDCYTQYVDYFDWYRRVLTDGANVFYSFGKSMGGNTFGLFAYYLASPLNLLIVFFPEGTTLTFMTVITIFKLGLCGLTCSIFLSKRFRLSTPLVLTLAIGYALCDYVATFSVCGIMWMEALILLPLVMLGVCQWLKEKKRALFLVSSVLAVYCCWFTAYMIFAFMILYYLYEYFLANGKVKAKRFWTDLLRFALLMILALALSMFILLPVIYAQMAGEAGDFTSGFYRAFFLKDFPAALFTGRANIAYVPQICCGTVTLFAIFMFFFSRDISRSEKIATALFLAFMVLSTFLMLLVEAWDGFRITRGYYCRFAFLICFLMVFVAARAFETATKPRKWQILLSGGVLFAAALTQYNDYIGNYYIYIVLGLVVLVTGCFLAFPKYRKLVPVLFVVITALEMGFNYYATLNILASNDAPAQTYQDYRLRESASYYELQAQDSSFYRVEKMYSRLGTGFRWQPPTNEGMAVGYSQISNYSSSNDIDLDAFLASMGYSRDDMGSSDFKQSIPLSDALLGIKYVYKADGTLIRNDGAMSLGYASSEDILGSLPVMNTESCAWYASLHSQPAEPNETGDPFAEQNEFVSRLLGEDVQVYKPLAVTQASDTDSLKEWQVNTDSHEKAYAYIDTSKMVRSTLSVGNDVLGEYNVWTTYYAFDISGLKDGQTIKLTPESPGDKLEYQTLIAYYVDEDVYNAAIAKLKEGEFNPDTVEDGYVHGSYSTSSDTLLFTTIPYDSGWTIRVNGQEVTPEKAAGAFIAIPLTVGDNEITMTYAPKGLYAGIVISGVALAGVIVVFVLRRRKRAAGAIC